MIDGGELNVALTATLDLGAGRAMTVQNGAYALISGGYALPASSTLTVTGANSKFIQDTLGSVNVSNGSTFNIGPDALVTTLTETIGHDSNGSAAQTGGTHTIAGTSAKLVLGTGHGVTGTYHFSGGNLNVTNSWANTTAVIVGANGTGNFVQTGGVHIVDGSHGSLVIGYGQTGVGTYSVTNGTVGCDTLDVGLAPGSKGTLTVNANSFVRALDGAVRLAPSPGATATATINAGGFMDGTSIFVVGGATEAGGAGVLKVAGGNVGTAGVVRLWDTAGSAINLSGGGLSAASVDTSGNPSRFNWTGGNLFITGAAGLDVSAAGPIGTAVTLGPGKSLVVDKRLHIGAGASVACVNGGSVFAGSLSGAGALLANVSFLFIGGDQTSTTFTGTTTGGGGISKGGAGTLTLARTRIANLAIHEDSIALIPSGGLPAATSTVSELTIDDGAKLDLADNKLIVAGGDVGTFDGAKYTGVTRQIASAYNFGSWDGTGIKTSMPDAQADHGITTLAIATADEVFYAGGTFGGVPVSSGDMLIMYTYAGDLNLDGQIDGADYGTLDNWIQFPGTSGYAKGDVNYDGVIDGADYGVLDNSIQLQGDPFPSGTYPAFTASTTRAVPEPASLSIMGFATASILGPRSCRSRRATRRERR